MKIFTRASLLICNIFFCLSLVTAQQKADSTLLPAKDKDTVIVSVADAADSPQNDTDSLPGSRKKKSYFKAGISYMNDNVYLGRKDSVALPYITPLLGYYHKSGLYVESSIGYLASASQSRIDVITFDGGYSFSAGKYEGDITISKFFYNSQSTSVKSALKGSLSSYNSYDFGFITPTLTATANFGNKTDFSGLFGLEHTFYALDDQLNITPAFSANASTQNYYDNYYRTRRYKVRKKGKAAATGITSVSGMLEDASGFKILDYEVSLPVNYRFGKFNLSFTPVYAIPVHPGQVLVTTTLANNTSSSKVRTEKIENNFFGTIGISYKFVR